MQQRRRPAANDRSDARLQTQQHGEPRYEIGAVAVRCGIHPQTVRQYERLGLIQPARSRGNFRLYSDADLERLQRIQRLVNDLGVNLAGDRKSTRLNSSHANISYAVFCLKKKKITQ